jgi:hypothetical protein
LRARRKPGAYTVDRPAPKIRIGTYSGRIRSASRPPLRKPSVSAAPIAPSSDSVGVPSTRPSDSTASSVPSSPNCIPNSGDAMASGSPVDAQCAAIFPEISAGSGYGESAICSSVPSAKSAAKRRGSDRSDASSAATQSTPGPSARRSAGSGPTPRGNKVTTIT